MGKCISHFWCILGSTLDNIILIFSVIFHFVLLHGSDRPFIQGGHFLRFGMGWVSPTNIRSSQFYLYSPLSQITNLPWGKISFLYYSIKSKHQLRIKERWLLFKAAFFVAMSAKCRKSWLKEKRARQPEVPWIHRKSNRKALKVTDS